MNNAASVAGCEAGRSEFIRDRLLANSVPAWPTTLRSNKSERRDRAILPMLARGQRADASACSTVALRCHALLAPLHRYAALRCTQRLRATLWVERG